MCMSIFHCSRHFCTQPWWSNMWSGLLPPELLVFLTEPIDYSWQLFFFFFFAETTRVQNARILTHSQNEISIQWEPPLNSEHVDTYEVKYYSEHPTSNMTSVYTTFTNYTFKNLQSETRYYFEVSLWLCLWCLLGGCDVFNTLRLRQMDAIWQTTFSSAFSWMKMFEFLLKFHWSLFLRVE